MEPIMRLIKQNGQRFTSQKKEILRALQQKPQTVREIYATVNVKKHIVDKATVYRILTSFIKLGIVHKVQLQNNEARFELVADKHHHHLVCEDCGGIEDIQFAEDTLLKVVQKKSSFKVKTHSLEFFGTCKNCQ